MRVKVGVLAVVTAAVVAAGCGGSAGGNKTGSGGESVAPANSAAYVALDSNLDSAAWNKAKALLDRFPGKAEIIADLRSELEEEGLDWETDVEPALGEEIDLVWLDFQDDGENVVGLTQPKDPDKFNALLAKSSNPPVQEEIDGWTVFARSARELNQFINARDNGLLDNESSFSDSFGNLPSDSLVRAWVRGGTLQNALDQQLESSNLPSATTESQFGTLDAITAAVTPGSDGIRIASTLSGDLKLGGSNFHPELPSELPGGAIVYFSFGGVGSYVNKLLDTYASSIPSFDQQRAQIELVLGYSLEEVLGLLDGEAALVVYPAQGADMPTLLLAAAVSDESKAQTILNRIASLATASGDLNIQSVQIGSVQAKEISLSNSTTAYVAVFDGKLVATNSRDAIQQMQGTGAKLADDPAYKAAVEGSGMPDETSGFIYSDLSAALPYAFDYAENHDRAVPEVVRENTAPLQGLLLYASKDGGGLTLSGFLGIE